MNYFFLHLGLHKTGTTSLQTDVFPSLELHYLGRFASKKEYGSTLYKKILKYCFSKKKDGKLLHELRVELKLLLKTTSLLISEEWFTSNYDPFTKGRGDNWQRKLYRLSEVVETLPVKLLITSRDPAEAAFSFYCELFQHGYTCNYDSFFEFAMCDDSVLCYNKKYLRSLLRGFFKADPEFIEFSDLVGGNINHKLSSFFEANVDCVLVNRNKKFKSKTGVSALKKSYFYDICKTLWYLLPRKARSYFSEGFIDALRGSLIKYRGQQVIQRPSDLDMKKVKCFLGEGE